MDNLKMIIALLLFMLGVGLYILGTKGGQCLQDPFMYAAKDFSKSNSAAVFSCKLDTFSPGDYRVLCTVYNSSLDPVRTLKPVPSAYSKVEIPNYELIKK